MWMSVLLVLFAAAQTASPAPAPPACDAPEFSQFDFWLGEWDVFGAKGTRAGRNSITRAHGGCVVLERWTSATGGTGSSFNIYTPSTKKWHQIWVDSVGTLLQLEGGLVNGSMRLEGEGWTPQGRMLNRITWTPRPDRTVRQLWEISTDQGQTWQASFDGSYRKAAK
jgi:hypothetical protein